MFLQEMFNVNLENGTISVPKESLFIESACLSLKFLIKIRRLMFLWHILHLDKKELLFEFYRAQSMVCHKNDWVEQVIKYKVDIDLQLSDNEIALISKEKFRVLVKNKTKVIRQLLVKVH